WVRGSRNWPTAPIHRGVNCSCRTVSWNCSRVKLSSMDGSFFSAFIAVTSMPLSRDANLSSGAPALRHPITPFLLEPTKTDAQPFALGNAYRTLLHRQSEEWISRDDFELAQLAQRRNSRSAGSQVHRRSVAYHAARRVR